MNLHCIAPAAVLGLVASASGQTVVPFDFDSAPLQASLPLDIAVNGVTAHLSATGQGYSIQSTSTAVVVPAGFSGRFVYPNSIYLADLLIGFSQPVTSFAIQYSPNELGCDTSCTMRVTAYTGATLVGTNTMTATNPGTWPVDTLGCTFAQGFDNVVVHYDSPPPTCSDYGGIFIADNMSVTLAGGSFSTFGPGCAGSLPVTHLVAQAPPRLGNTLLVALDNLPISAAYLFIGWSRSLSTFGPLPLATAALGMPGCTAYVSDDFVFFLSGSGHAATFLIPIPNDVGLLGLRFYQQALVPDPAAGNALLAVLADAVAAEVGQ